jgi:hypothetical protein
MNYLRVSFRLLSHLFLGFFQSIIPFLNPFIAVQIVRQNIGQVVTAVREYILGARHKAIVLFLPFGGLWQVVRGGTTRQHSHSWGVLSQRYALDFVALGDGDNTHTGSGRALKDFYSFDNPIYAPCNGIVIEAVDGHRDQKPGWSFFSLLKIRDIRGNYLLIREPSGQFCLLAHLRRGSLRVTRGSQVTVGMLVAECGNSGNTSQPHLHIHTQSNKSFYSSIGIPITFCNALVRDEADLKFYPSTAPLKVGDVVCVDHLISDQKPSIEAQPIGLEDLIVSCSLLLFNVAALLTIYWLLMKLIFKVIGL